MTSNHNGAGEEGQAAPQLEWVLFDYRIARMPPDLSTLSADLRRYAQHHPHEHVLATTFSDFLRSDPAVFLRSHALGHFTGSAWLVSADGERVLLMHHRKLDRWLQPGGHTDGDADLARVALREAQEETGVAGLRSEPKIFDIDRHRIPARGHEPEHWHYDVRYVICASADERFTVNEESHALAWRRVAELASDADVDASLRRMATKWLARKRT